MRYSVVCGCVPRMGYGVRYAAYGVWHAAYAVCHVGYTEWSRSLRVDTPRRCQ